MGTEVKGASVLGAAVGGAGVSGASVNGARVSGATVGGEGVGGALVSGAGVGGDSVSGGRVEKPPPQKQQASFTVSVLSTPVAAVLQNTMSEDSRLHVSAPIIQIPPESLGRSTQISGDSVAGAIVGAPVVGSGVPVKGSSVGGSCVKGNSVSGASVRGESVSVEFVELPNRSSSNPTKSSSGSACDTASTVRSTNNTHTQTCMFSSPA